MVLQTLKKEKSWVYNYINFTTTKSTNMKIAKIVITATLLLLISCTPSKKITIDENNLLESIQLLASDS